MCSESNKTMNKLDSYFSPDQNNNIVSATAAIIAIALESTQRNYRISLNRIEEIL